MTATTSNDSADDLEDDVIDDDTDVEDWAPPARDEWERITAEAKKANSEAATRKRLLRELGYDKNGNRIEGAAVVDDAAKPVVQPVDTKTVETGLAKKYEAIYSGLAGAGVPAGQLGRLARFIDTSSVLIDEDGIEGLSEQIESLRTDYPELFKRQRQKAPDANTAGAGKKTVSKASNTGSWEDEARRRIENGTFFN
ncbi:hypothetical protein OHS59_16245 [Streptomyces sp. NBC_00414]|uniref:phage scaffolding protein n=1 Tax=Streptomyces sp. NBC_00414 TaxID=2975739 RepID=UPI002E236989